LLFSLFSPPSFNNALFIWEKRLKLAKRRVCQEIKMNIIIDACVPCSVLRISYPLPLALMPEVTRP